MIIGPGQGIDLGKEKCKYARFKSLEAAFRVETGALRAERCRTHLCSSQFQSFNRCARFKPFSKVIRSSLFLTGLWTDLLTPLEKK